MGPLWAWVVLWLLSAYGLVILLRSAMARSVSEPVPVLVATPRPVEPELSPASLEPPAEAGDAPEAIGEAEREPRSQEATLEAATIDEAPLEAPRDPLQQDDLPEGDAVVTPLEIDDLPLPPAAEGPEAEEGGADAPWIKERSEREASDPWIEEREPVEASEPWISDKEEAGPAESAVALSDEIEPIVYRTIDLESLALGLQATEIQDLYGPPGHMSKVGEDGEQWRYPLNATDDRGEGVEGVLVLEFQRGRLVRKALEQLEAGR